MKMDTKSLIIDIATTLFQKKGYLGVGLNEILKECNMSKGSLYHHFPKGKEELLIACLHSLDDTITTHMKEIFRDYPTTQMATQAMIEKLVIQFEGEGMIIGYTISSIVSEMGALSESVRNACALSFTKIQEIYLNKLVEDGFSEETANSISLMLTALIEGGIMLCLAKKTSEPLKMISQGLPNLFREL